MARKKRKWYPKAIYEYMGSAPVKKSGQRLGIAKGKFKVPDDIDVYNDENML